MSLSPKRRTHPEFEELKNICKNYHVFVLEDARVIELLQRKFPWLIETIPIEPNLSVTWKQRLFIYFILYHEVYGRNFKSYSIDSFMPLPRGIVMPAIGLSTDKQHLHMIFIQPAPTLPNRNFRNMKETIEEDRRVTIGNILRWSHQLFRFTSFLHKNYITFRGNLQLNQVLLPTDSDFIQQMKEWIQVETVLKHKYRLKEEDLAPIPKIEYSGRQVWIDFNIFPSSFSSTHQHSAPITKPMSRKERLRTAVSPPKRSQSPSSPERHPERQLSISDSLYLFNDLRNLDLDGNWRLTQKAILNPEYETNITQQFLDYSQHYQHDLRAIGIIILQLIQRHVFNEKEMLHWLTWNPVTDDHKPVQRLINRMNQNPELITRVRSADLHDVGSIKSQESKGRDGVSVLSTSENGEEKQNDDNNSQVTDVDILTQTERQLIHLLPDVKNIPEPLKKLLAICFLPITYPFHQLIHTKLHFNLLMKLPYINLFLEMMEELEQLVIVQENDKLYVKESTWTEADEEARLKAHKVRAKEMKQKAIEGVKNAVARIRQEKESVWWSLQSQEYRMNTKKRRKARAITDERFRKRRELFHQAYFHRWEISELEQWIRQAILNYYSMVSKHRDSVEQQKPKKPEVYIHRIITEIFSPLDSFYIAKIIGKYSYLYEEEVKAKRLLEAKKREEELEKNAYLRLAGGKKTKITTKTTSNSKNPSRYSSRTGTAKATGSRSASSLTTLPTNIDEASWNNTNTTPGNEEVSLLHKPIHEKMNFCYRAMASQLARLFVSHSNSMVLCKAIRKAIQAEQTESLQLIGKTLIISEEQHFFKRLFLQTKYLIQGFTDLKYTITRFFEELQIIDRDRLKSILLIFTQALLYQYHQEETIRRQGEEIAASRIIAFFRLIYTKQVYLPQKLAGLQEKAQRLLELQEEKQRQLAIQQQLIEEEERQKSQTIHSIYESYTVLPVALRPKPPPEPPLQIQQISLVNKNSLSCQIRCLLFPWTEEIQELYDHQVGMMMVTAGLPSPKKYGSQSSSHSFDAFDFKKAFREDRRQHLWEEWSRLTPVAYRVTHLSPIQQAENKEEKEEVDKEEEKVNEENDDMMENSFVKTTKKQVFGDKPKEEIVIYLKHPKQLHEEQYLQKKDYFEQLMDHPEPASSGNPISNPTNRSVIVRKYPIKMNTTTLFQQYNPNINDYEIFSSTSETKQYANVLDLDLTIVDLPPLTTFRVSIELSPLLTQDLYDYQRDFFLLYPTLDYLTEKALFEEKQREKEIERSRSRSRSRDIYDSPIQRSKSSLMNEKGVTMILPITSFTPIQCEAKTHLKYHLMPSKLTESVPHGIHLRLPSYTIKTKTLPPYPIEALQVSVVYYSSYLHTPPKDTNTNRSSLFPITNISEIPKDVKGAVSLPSSDLPNYQRINIYSHWPYELYFDVSPHYHVIQQFSALIRLSFLESLEDRRDVTQYEIQRCLIVSYDPSNTSSSSNSTSTSTDHTDRTTNKRNMIYQGHWEVFRKDELPVNNNNNNNRHRGNHLRSDYTQESSHSTKQQPVGHIVDQGVLSIVHPPYPPELSSLVSNPTRHSIHQQDLSILSTYDYFTTDCLEKEESTAITSICHYINDHFTDLLVTSTHSMTTKTTTTSNPSQPRLIGLIPSQLQLRLLYRIRVINSQGISSFLKLQPGKHSVALGTIWIAQEDFVKKGKLWKVYSLQSKPPIQMNNPERIEESKGKREKDQEKEWLLPKKKLHPLGLQLLQQSSVSFSRIEDTNVSRGNTDESLTSLSSRTDSIVITPAQPAVVRSETVFTSREEDNLQKSPSPTRSPIRMSDSPSHSRIVENPPTQENVPEDPQTKWLKALQMTSPLIVDSSSFTTSSKSYENTSY